MDEDKRARATRIANSRDAASRIDVHWLVSEAIAAWHKAEVLQAEIALLRADNARLLTIVKADPGIGHLG